MAKQIKLVKSLSGRKKDQVATANSLGLKKIGDVTVQPENAATLGKIQKISHLVEVQEASTRRCSRMKLHELSPAAGSVKDVKRVGRGHGSGNGKTAGKGHKGQNARSGGGVRIGFEGGQMPIARRIPKRGFKNIFGTDYAIVNVADLNQFAEGTVVDAELLKATGLVKKVYAGVKVLGNGELTTKLTVKAAKFSKSAVEKIEKAGGKAEVM